MTALIDETPRVPVVLPHLSIAITSSGALTVLLDKAPYDVPSAWAGLGREAVPKIVNDIATRLASPVRVDVEDDGATFTDIVTPGSTTVSTLTEAPVPSLVGGEVVGSGFLPAEPVAIAVVVAQQTADASGVARLRLPPALLAHRAGVVVLLGKKSLTAVVSAGAT